MENNKKIIITVLSVLVVAMAVGYALLAQELTINGSASIDSTWKVEITNITSKDVVGGAVNKVDPSYTATTANFSVGFTQPGDSITYDITVTNKGTLDAVVESITVNKGDNPAITYTTSGLKRGDKIAKSNETNTLTVKVDYDSNVTSQPASTTNNITVTINYEQDLGQVPAYETYSIGDTIEFAGSNWRVINNSTTEEDYVTLFKEKILTHDELGNYAITYNNVPYDTMPYYWSSTCHYKYTIGGITYSDNSYQGCANHYDYAGSKVKEFLEGDYLTSIGTNKLKEVEGYKIRLITIDELLGNLGYSMDVTSAGDPIPNENVPTWVYQNFKTQGSNAHGYWTTTPYRESNGSGFVSSSGNLNVTDAKQYEHGVRPVINLLKSSIE